MKKYRFFVIVAALILALGCLSAAHAAVIPPEGPGQQIGYTAVVLCESLALRAQPNSTSEAIQYLKYGDRPIVIGADTEAGAQEENGFLYCTVGDGIDSPCGWVNKDYVVVNPAWYVTEYKTIVYAWNDEGALKVAQLDEGTRLPILKEDGAWYLVSLRGAAGWIRK